MLADLPGHFAVGRGLVDPRDVLQLQPFAGLVGKDFQFPELGRRARPPLAADLARDAVGLQRPAGQVEAGTRNALGDFVQRQVEPPQRLRGHFHPEFALAQAAHADRADAPLQQGVADLPGVRFQRAFGERTGNLDIADDLGGRKQPDYGPLHFLGEGRHPRNRRLHVGEGLGHVAAVVEIEQDHGASLERRGVHPVEVVQAHELPFQRLDHVRLDVLGAGAHPGDVDLDLLQREVGHELAVELAHSQQSEQDHQRHQQVAGHLVAGRRKRAGGWRPREVVPDYSTITARAFSPASRSCVMTTCSPSASPFSGALPSSINSPS